ncbi:MAG: hypothetical protein BWY80_00807 [Firmicutes bacterium ADurb.Bin456]|nr:MAG: hypothetical protein BWY80_00807 [Firmicutes bacterium ADurb.Bin456]
MIPLLPPAGAPGFLLLPVLFGFVAAGLAWQFNKGLGRLPGAVPVCLAPLVEEMAKTVPAAFFNVDIFYTHFIFGLVEGTWELLSGRPAGFYAGLTAVASHSIFGFSTVLVLQTRGSLVLALGTAVLAHAAWNHVVFRYLEKTPGAKR